MRKPKYQQIINELKEQISNGVWPIGSKLPSQRELAKKFGVNRSTVITALQELEADGLIKGRMGMGTIVVNNTWTLLGADPAANWNENVHLGIHQASMQTVQTINRAENDNQLIQLSKGELAKDLFPLEEMKQIIQTISHNLDPFGYEEPKGNPRLRENLSSYLREKGIIASPSSILIVSGGLQALQLISIGLLQTGSTVFLEQPSYLYSLSVFQSAGMKLFGISLDKEGIRADMIPGIHKKHQKGILYCIPAFHNPTGVLMSEKRRAELIRIAEKEQLPIIEDDVYGDLWFDVPPPSPLKAGDRHGNILYLGSLSKSLNPGLRIGWVVGPEPVIDRLADLKMQTDYGSSTLSQKAAAEWLSSGLYDRHLKIVREQLQIKRDAAIAALSDYLSDFAEWTIPLGGFYIWVRMKSGLALKDLHAKALARGVLVNPGSIYSEQKTPSFRLSFAYASATEIRKGIKILGEILKND